MKDPTAPTLREAVAAIAQGKLSAEALVEACLDRVERLQPMLNCFINVTAERARRLPLLWCSEPSAPTPAAR